MILKDVKITLGRLRKYLRSALSEAGGGPPRKPEPYVRNAMAPASADREQLGRLSLNDDEEELAPHLRDQDVEPEECWGPVPPVNGDPYVGQDPFARDMSPLPTSPIKR